MENMQHYANPQEYPERKLWRAVVATTVHEWVSGTLRKQREAEQFLFQDERDYREVCLSAGIDPSDFRARLEKIRSRKNVELQTAISPK